MTKTPPLKAPFPWFGGKRRVAAQVWAAFGDVDNYIEPFAGSLAVLLGRPTEPRFETVNDIDHYLCNFWRAIKADPAAVATHTDWPVNEADLFSRHMWLMAHREALIQSQLADPDFYDAKVAGWWVWGLSAWIGGDWCSGRGPWQVVEGKVTRVKTGGVRSKRPTLRRYGDGVHGKALRGAKIQRPDLWRYGHGTNGLGLRGGALPGLLQRLSERLRHVRVCCGDWSRVLTRGVLSSGDTLGVFLDPPYSQEVRDRRLYTNEEDLLSTRVREWALGNAKVKGLRIALCGYFDEHAAYMPRNWRLLRYSAASSIVGSHNAALKRGNANNRHNEAIWFSPQCLEGRKDPCLT